MVSPQETGAFQPQPSLEKGKKLGGLRGKFAKATLFAGGLTAAAAGAVNAGGNAMLITGEGGTTGEFCDNGDYVLVTDFDYAAKLTEQLASGELIIAFGPAPVAALKEGDKTAAVQPTTITPDEIWANLAKPAPECPVVVEPITVDSVIEDAFSNPDQIINKQTVDNAIKKAFNADPEAANTKFPSRGNLVGLSYKQSAIHAWKLARNGDTRIGGNQDLIREEGYIGLGSSLYHAYLVNENSLFLTAFKDIILYMDKSHLPAPMKDEVINQLKLYASS